VRKLFSRLAFLSLEVAVVLLLFIISFLGFLFLINRVIRLNNDAFDLQVFQFLLPWINPANTRIMVIFSFFADHYFLLPANIIVALYFLFFQKYKWYSITVPVVSLGSFMVMSSLKLFFSRPRPDHPVYEAARGFSFPSGHAMSAMTFYGLLIWLIWNNLSNRVVKWSAVLFLSLFIFTIGFSRVYLRVHYASDVLAGFLMGIIWLVLSVVTINKIHAASSKKAVQSETKIN